MKQTSDSGISMMEIADAAKSHGEQMGELNNHTSSFLGGAVWMESILVAKAKYAICKTHCKVFLGDYENNCPDDDYRCETYHKFMDAFREEPENYKKEKRLFEEMQDILDEVNEELKND